MRYLFGDCCLDTARYELRRAGVRIPLRSKVFHLLAYLITPRDRVGLKDELIAHLWPNQRIGDTALKSCILTARKVVGDAGRAQRVIQTLHGHGYRFVAAVTTEDQPAPASVTLPRLSGASAPPAPHVETMPDPVIGLPRTTAHTLAQQIAHPLSLALALIWAAVVHHLRREVPLIQAHAEAATTIATDQGFPQQLAQAMSLRGWVLVACGQGEEGIAQIHHSLAAYR